MKKSGNERLRSLSDEQLLIDAGLIVDEHITYAALILLGTQRALTKHLAQAEVIFEYRSSEASGPAQSRREYREAFMTYHDRLWKKIDLRNERQSYQDDLIVRDLPTFDEAQCAKPC